MAKSKFQQLLNSAVTTNPEELKNWIEKEINAKDQNQETVLHKACAGGNLPTVKYLIQIGAQIEAKAELGETPLHMAVGAGKGHLEIVQCLIDHGAQIDTKDDNEETPLIYAVLENHLEVVKCLVENGAQIENKDKNERTPLFFAR